MSIRTKLKKGLIGILLAGALSLVGCKDKDDPIILPPPVNNAPVITSTAPTEIHHNSLYSYDVDATDPENDSITYSLSEKPAGMTIDSNTGLIQWPTTMSNVGLHNVVANASDGVNTTSQSFQINVINDAPTITSTAPLTATENQTYTYDVNATDIENDTITYSLLQGPLDMTIDSNTGVIQWTPKDADANQDNYVMVEAYDGNKADTETWTLNPMNVSDVSGWILECGTGNPLENAEVNLGALTTYTDSSGKYTFSDVPDGGHLFVAGRNLNQVTHVMHTQGTLSTTQEREHAGKLINLETRLTPEEHYQFVDECTRNPPDLPSKNCIQKWKQKPVFDFYTLEYTTGNPVSQDEIDLVKNKIKNKISGNFYDSSGNLLTFTDSDINIIPTLPPSGQPLDYHIKIYWNNTYDAGGNHSWTDNNEIISAGAFSNEGLKEARWFQELIETMIASGETNDINYIDSPLYSPSQTTNTNYSINCKFWIDFHKHRVIGNKDENDGNPEHRDMNSPETPINP